MRKTWGILLMVTGVLLMLGSGWLLMKNRQEDRNASGFVQMVLPEIQQEIHQAMETIPAETESEEIESIPEEFEPEVIETILEETEPETEEIEFIQQEDPE